MSAPDLSEISKTRPQVVAFTRVRGECNDRASLRPDASTIPPKINLSTSENTVERVADGPPSISPGRT